MAWEDPSAPWNDDDPLTPLTASRFVATLKSLGTYTDALAAAIKAFVYKGAKDCSANPKYPAAVAGETYTVSVAGKIGGASGVSVAVGDLLICKENAAEGTQAEVGTKWDVLQVAGAYATVGSDGTVGGPGGTSLSASVVSASSSGGVETWESGQTYKPNALIAFKSQLYLAKSEHTSGAGFEHAKWQPINPLYAEYTPEFWGAKGDGTTDDTTAAQAVENFVNEKGGGEVVYGPFTYIVDGLEWKHQVWHRGSSAGTTKLKAKAGSTNAGQILQAKGLVKHVGWRHFTFEPNGNVGQQSFYLFAETGGATEGGINYADFEHCTWLGEWSGHALWFDGGKTGAKFPHQFVNFKQCFISHRNSGAVAKAASGELIGPTTARAIKCTGQCAKFKFDSGTSLQGKESEISAVGSCNVELTRKFTFATTLKSDAAAGATVINLESATGFATNQVFTIGEGYHNELCEVESVSGTEITLKAALVFAHAAADTNLRLLATGATNTPAFFTFESGCTLQNSDLHILAEEVRFLNVQRGPDMENQARGVLARKGCRQVNLDISLNGASRGTPNGTGTLTVGSTTVTASGGTWAEGDVIFAKGIKAGTTVTNVAGATLTISNAVEANGTEGPVASIPLTKGGDGEGFVAKFEGESEGTVSYDTTGAVDRTVVQV